MLALIPTGLVAEQKAGPLTPQVRVTFTLFVGWFGWFGFFVSSCQSVPVHIQAIRKCQLGLDGFVLSTKGVFETQADTGTSRP